MSDNFSNVSGLWKMSADEIIQADRELSSLIAATSGDLKEDVYRRMDSIASGIISLSGMVKVKGHGNATNGSLGNITSRLKNIYNQEKRMVGKKRRHRTAT